MNITIVAVGKLKESFWRDACDEYLKRCQPYARLLVVEVPDVDQKRAGGVQQALTREGETILSAIPERALVVALAIEGKSTSSEELSAWIDKQALDGKSDLAFVIGGSHGLAASVIKKADLKLSFGPLTLPHNLARVVLLEQLYRAFKISSKEPYHK